MLSPSVSVGDAKEGLELNTMTPSEEIDNAAASAPISESVGVSPSASVTAVSYTHLKLPTKREV